MKTTSVVKYSGPGSAACWTILTAVAVLALLHSPAWAVGFTTDFRLEECSWKSRGRVNPHFILRPGYRVALAGEEEDDEGELVEVSAEITVLLQTERITFESARGETLTVKTRVVEEREWEEGELVEVSRNWFAICRETSDVYYFGEEVDIYEDGEIVSHDGAWRAGEEGALPGIIMPGTFLLGSKYYQELAPDVALDRARHVAMGLEVSTPAGTFTDCVAVVDSSPLAPGESDRKVYCPGIGVVMDEALMLVDYGVVALNGE